MSYEKSRMVGFFLRNNSKISPAWTHSFRQSVAGVPYSSIYEAGKSDQTEGGEAFAGHSAHSRHLPYYAWYIYYDIVVPRLAAAAHVALGAAA